MAIQAVFKLPFKEQERFFREKLNIPTQKWTDLWKDQHAKGFMVAGAYRADLLSDFRSAVDKAIGKGTTLADFRRDFDSIVAQHGWSYNGSRKWRSELIYSTNIRTAYAAGRWEQMTDPDVMDFYGYLEYRHGDSRVPRPEHLAWDGLVLPANDPWWQTHYPPNGWGCKCRVFAATAEQWQAAGSKGQAPPSPIDPKTGEPVGIDEGWGYNVGEAAKRDYRVLADKFESLPHDIARKWMGDYVNSPVFEHFIAGKIGGEFPVAVLDEPTMKLLGTQNQVVWVSEDTISMHRTKHPEIGLPEYRILPEIVDSGEIYRKGADRIIYLWRDEKLYRAAIKKTKSDKGNYVLTMFQTTDKVAERNVRTKYERVR